MSSNWDSITSCPRDGSDFIAWDHIDEAPFIVHFSATTQRFYSDHNCWCESELSHWTPLPEGPK